MLRQNDYGLMVLATPGEALLRYLQDKRKLSHGHERVAVIKKNRRPSRDILSIYARCCAEAIVNRTGKGWPSR